MNENVHSKTIVELQEDFEEIKSRLIRAVENSVSPEEVELLKRNVEKIASEIRKIDVNRNV